MTARTRKRPAPAPAFGALDYPSSDGEPASESDWHLRLLFESTTRLDYRYADDPDVYVSGNLLVYYQEGDPRLRLAPDCFVVFGVPKGNRETFKTWVEQAYPAVVFEFTSYSTKDRDTVTKFAVYQDVWEVDEYFLFDPREEYLTPSLIGYRRDAYGDLVPIPRNADGGIFSERLNLTISRQGKSLAYRDAATAQLVLTANEGRARTREAQARLADALAELARVRKSP